MSYPTSHDYSTRDDSIAINSYTTVLRRPGVPHDLFATYWRDVHGPLCSRIPGLGWYVQHHFDRDSDAHLWPVIEGIAPFEDYTLDGFVEIGFAGAADQKTFQDASRILFSDEQNVFAATVAYDLPQGSTTLVDRIAEPNPNAEGEFDRIQVHFGADPDKAAPFRDALTKLAEALAGEQEVLKVRLHLSNTYDNANPAPPAPNVDHEVSQERRLLGIIELAFASPLVRRRFYASKPFATITEGLGDSISHAAAFSVSGVFTYVRDGKLTLAGLRGSRAAQLIEKVGAVNQVQDDVWEMLHRGGSGNS